VAQVDQSGNSALAARRNAELEGVADRTDLVTSDMRCLPFFNATFDVALSSLAIQYIPDAPGRAQHADLTCQVVTHDLHLAFQHDEEECR
jgi:arsenite methyltransferase